MQARAFNKITTNIPAGLLTKTSVNPVKLRDEINYYLNLPEEIAHFFPKLISHEKNFSSYTLQYIPYKSLSDLILNNQITLTEGENILHTLMGMLGDIHYFKPGINIPKENQNFYIKKTRERIEKLKLDRSFRQMVNLSYIHINNKIYKTFHILQPAFIKTIQNFFAIKSVTTAIHGDFCFSNILYCPKSKEIKLIDPRGSFGATGIYGNPDYDFAKLLHCLHGRYDLIVNNNFALEELNKGVFSFKRPHSSLLKKLHKSYRLLLIERGVNIELSYLIEASLFLSMAALHYECVKRQKALFLTGLIILNNFFEGKYENLH